MSLNLASILSGTVSDLATAVISGAVILATVIAARWGGSDDLSRYGRFIIVDDRPGARQSGRQGTFAS